jgi:hypothetical protein
VNGAVVLDRALAIEQKLFSFTEGLAEALAEDDITGALDVVLAVAMVTASLIKVADDAAAAGHSERATALRMLSTRTAAIASSVVELGAPTEAARADAAFKLAAQTVDLALALKIRSLGAPSLPCEPFGPPAHDELSQPQPTQRMVGSVAQAEPLSVLPAASEANLSEPPSTQPAAGSAAPDTCIAINKLLMGCFKRGSLIASTEATRRFLTSDCFRRT